MHFNQSSGINPVFKLLLRRKYNHPRIHDDVTIDNLLPHVQKPLGLRHIRTKLYSVPLSRLRQLQTEALTRRITEQHTPEYKLIGVVLDIAQYRLFKPTQTGPNEEETRSFLKIHFKNKDLDAINLSNILHHKKVTSTIPAYFKPRQPLISYSYTTPIASKIFNALQDFTTNAYASSPSACNCAASPFNYGPASHVITGDHNIIQNVELKTALSKGPKYREPQTWRQNFKIIMDSVGDYAKR